MLHCNQKQRGGAGRQALRRHARQRAGAASTPPDDEPPVDEDPDGREPGRTVELHLTGHMERFSWSFDGEPFASAEPLRLNYGERMRIVLVNDTMMTHPILINRPIVVTKHAVKLCRPSETVREILPA